MAAGRKSSGRSKKTYRKKETLSHRVERNYGVTIPVLLLLCVFIAAAAYGMYLETGGEKSEPEQIVSNFIEKDADLAVYYFDVGQGDSSIIKYKNKTVLIDAGEKDMGGTVVGYLNDLGIERLDYIIATHPHSDHIGGLPEVISSFEIGTVIAPRVSDEMTPTTKVYERFLTALSEKGLRLTAAKTGTVYSLADESLENDNTAFEIIAPVKDDYDDLNDWSVGIRLVHGETAFIFTGDAEKGAEKDMIESGAELAADVLKTPHHGSGTSSSKAFLEAVDPSIAIISCGDDNSYGHPHAETLDKFKEYGIKYYRTDGCGTVTVYSDGESIKVVTEKEVGNNVDN